MNEEDIITTISAHLPDGSVEEQIIAWCPKHQRTPWKGKSAKGVNLDNAIKNARQYAKKSYGITPVVVSFKLDRSGEGEPYLCISTADESEIDSFIPDTYDIYCDLAGTVIPPVEQSYESHEDRMTARGGRFARKVSKKKNSAKKSKKR